MHLIRWQPKNVFLFNRVYATTRTLAPATKQKLIHDRPSTMCDITETQIMHVTVFNRGTPETEAYILNTNEQRRRLMLASQNSATSTLKSVAVPSTRQDPKPVDCRLGSHTAQITDNRWFRRPRSRQTNVFVTSSRTAAREWRDFDADVYQMLFQVHVDLIGDKFKATSTLAAHVPEMTWQRAAASTDRLLITKALCQTACSEFTMYFGLLR